MTASAPASGSSGNPDRELLRRYHEHGDIAAREELVERHLPLVRSLARRYAGRGESIEDIEQVGAIGLIKAIDRYELSREVALTTYATPNVVGEIKRHFRDRGWTIRIPRALPPVLMAHPHFFFLDDLLATHLGPAFRLEGEAGFLRLTRVVERDRRRGGQSSPG